MTGEKGGLLAGLRAEALKSRHAAPVRLAVLMALPMPLLGAMPYRGVQIFSAWNYWYALFLPVSLSLVVACVARADARTRMRGLLGLGFPLRRAWWAKALWCLALCALSNLVVFGIYLAGSAFSSQGLTAAGTFTMLLCALANTVTAAWMIPAGLFLTARLGMLAGIFCPLAAQLMGGFAWSPVPLPQLFPPSASMVIPTSFIPVLPSGEPLAADMALGGALAADGVLTLAGLAVCALAFAALTAAGAAWHLVIEVADDGPGFSPAALERGCERLFTDDSSRSSRDGGRHYGLGLHAASEAASAHGGSVSLANNPSGGAVATIAVPLCGI